MKRSLAILLALCLLTALLCGCGVSGDETQDPLGLGEDETETPPAENVEVTAFTLPYLEGQTLDPITCGDSVQSTVGALLYEGLFALSPAFEVENRLCDHYTYDAGALLYTLHLRSGVFFSDGSALTAADAVKTLNRAMTSERYRARLANVASVRASGDDTLLIALRSDSRSLPALLDIPIVKSGTESLLVPLGTGPYVFVSAAGGAELQRSSAWWKGEALPLQTIPLSAVKDMDMLSYQFSSYEIQLFAADLVSGEAMRVTGSVAVTDAPTTTLHYLGFNCGGVFADAALRTAVSQGVSRSGAVSGYLSGHGTPAEFPLSPASPLYPADLSTEYSVDQFAAAMTAAGYGADSAAAQRSVTLLVNEESAYKVAIAGYLADALSAYRLTVQVKSLPWAQYLSALQSGSFDLYYGEVRMTADWDARPLIGTGGAANYGHYSDERMDTLLAACASSPDQAGAFHRLCSYFSAQTPIVPLFFQSCSVLTQKSVLAALTPTAENPYYGMAAWDVQLAK